MGHYRFLTDCYFAPLGDRHYPTNATEELTDWSSETIRSALAAGIIVETFESTAEKTTVEQEDLWQKSSPETHVSSLPDTTFRGTQTMRH